MSRETGIRLGFIGLGVMGEPMCRNLIAAGKWPVIAHDLRGEPLHRVVSAGAKAGSTAPALADETDVIITCLPGGDQVHDLYFGTDRLMDRIRKGQTLVDMSTSPPSLMRDLAAAASHRGASFADAPIARTRQAAKDGTLAIMVGADQAVFEALLPILSAMGSDVVHCGAIGAGQIVKIMNNMVLFQTVQALAEAITLAEGAGVDGEILLDTMSKGSGDSFALRNHAMMSLLPETYPEHAFAVHYAAKDLAYALDMADEQKVGVPGALNMARQFDEAINSGFGDCYFPVVRRLLKKV
ncbi:MAG: NAD(P)-dependent oxidoreductase [Pseudomonadota bacterium]